MLFSKKMQLLSALQDETDEGCMGEKVNLQIQVDSDLKKRIAIAAIEQDKTMSRLVEDLLLEKFPVSKKS